MTHGPGVGRLTGQESYDSQARSPTTHRGDNTENRRQSRLDREVITLSKVAMAVLYTSCMYLYFLLL